MGKLLFYDEQHLYSLDGEILPSVSEVTRFISREVYGDVQQYSLDNACDRGTKVHKATELLDKYGEVECDNDIIPYIQAYIAFRKDYGITSDNILEIESAYGDHELGFAGTLDRLFRVGDENWIVDLKSSSAAQKRLWGTAINGYKLLWEKNHTGEKIDKLFDLHLKKDGTYKLLEMEKDPTNFNACLTLHNLMKSTRKTKKEKKK